MGAKLFVKRTVKAILPYGILKLYRENKERREFNYKCSHGGGGGYCPICEKKTYFEPFGFHRRQSAKCARCASLERHRLLWLFLQRKTEFFNQKASKVLHIAPEPCLEKRFKKILGDKYITADLYKNAMVKMDITDIQEPDESFDAVICNHVLEHVHDDKKAMNEFYRILKKEGWAILLVPIANMDRTYEDPSIKTDGARFWAFGQNDHVRKYGKDYIDRLKSAGFTVSVVPATDIATAEEIEKMCLTEKDTDAWGFTATEIYYCKK